MGSHSVLVWELVQSLSEPEVQKFKDRAYQYKRGRYAKYIVLFDALRKQSAPDEAELQKLLRGSINTTHLHRTKNYLYSRILEYIREAHQDDESVLYGMVEKIKILFQKGLYHHMPPLLKKATTLAKATEDFVILIRLVRFRLAILRAQRQWETFEAEMQALTATEQEIRLQLENLLLLESYEHRFLTIWNKPYHEKLALIHAAQDDDLIQDTNRSLSLSGRIIQEHVQMLCHYFFQEYNEVVAVADRIVGIFASRPQLSQHHERSLVLGRAIFYASSFRVLTGEYSVAKRLYQERMKWAQLDRQHPVFVAEHDALFGLSIAWETKDRAVGETAISVYEARQASLPFQRHHPGQTKINHMAGIFLLLIGEPKKSLRYIRGNKDLAPKAQRGNLLLHFSRILFLIAHTDLDNPDVVLREVRSAKAHYRRIDLLNDYMIFVLNLMAALAKGKVPHPTLLQEAREFLRERQSDRLFESMANYFDLELWLRSKLAKMPMIQVINP